MRISKQHIIASLLYLIFMSSYAQDQYAFIPKDQHLLTNEALKTIEVVITPDILLFSERGQLLPMSKMELMSNPDYTPLFFANSVGKIKSIVFQNRKNNPVLIQKNPEAAFTKGELARDFIAYDINNNRIKLSDLRGKIVVLNFWFTSCGPCKLEIPSLNKLVAKYKNKDVVFLALTFNEKAKVEQFINSSPFNYKHVVSANDAINIYGVQSYPTSIVINKKGEIVLKELGYRTNIDTVLSNAINELL